MIVQTGVLCKWTNDSQRFLLEHFDTIHDSPSHIYHSALPFSPSSSWLHKYYGPGLSQEVQVIKGLPDEWGTCSRTVSLDSPVKCLSYWNNTIAVGSWSKNIIILNAITGIKEAILSGHTDGVRSVTHSSDGRLLASGSDDKTVKLWDIQTGGVVKTFHGHTKWVLSVSISADCTRIASGSNVHTICLWDIQTGDCYCIIKQEDNIQYVSFYPTDPQHLLSICNNQVWKWDVNGHQIPPTYHGTHIAFSPDYTQFALCNKSTITVQQSDSRVAVAEFHVAGGETRCCCFSPDGKLVAVAADRTAYVWDITTPDPHLIETFVGHTNWISSDRKSVV